MSSSLFRKEAIKNNTQRLLGEVLLIRPISFWIFTVSIMLVVAMVGALLLFGKFARRETVAGYLVPDKGLVRVYAPFNGIIDQKYITDGQKVTKGQNLLEVTTERGTKDSLSINQQLITRLEEQKANLEQRIIDETQVLDSESNRLTVILANHNSEYYQIRQQLQSQGEQLQLIKNQWERYKTLREKGLVSEDELLIKRNAYFNAKTGIDATKRLQINKQTEIANIQKQLEQSPLRKSNRLQELQQQFGQLEERLIELSNSRSYMIKAPVNGHITSTQVNIGQNVSSAIPILTVIPENTILHAELFLPSRAIGFVKKDQTVLMRYDAFPYQRYGLYEGKIVQIAEAVIHPNEASIPVAMQEPVYRIKVALDVQNINAYGKKMRLQSGMSVAADIILEERSLGEWLLEPIYSLKGKI
ncbi:HlyD family efflux transporter periplasmic adaptor subunit [Aquimarina gracilis]|uniref:HlyD family efflux transporter periplasmic adaptor subunit n=1 Tax=Aquimarina gracilis TaxID=874422 RepID=A0ABU6A1U3_9FLAO|nr:HlyD family efflux transporter periplasmic adaptor subunit [Aquimarina gracilis]MEB3348015.1 HlyD family efflux transporter periplasmic adaptor subunit [Aquimarina gracilis]